MAKLILKSNSLDLRIETYEQITFKHGNFVYYDTYMQPELNRINGKYVIYVETPDINVARDLNRISIELNVHVEMIMVFFKYITGTCPFSAAAESFDMRRKRFICANRCPDGWSSNYDEVEEILNDNPSKIRVKLMQGVRYAHISESPLKELKMMLEKYDSINPNIKYLMRLNYEADLASDNTRCLVYGKVLEIINALHPFRGKNDNRIQEYYPELKDIFGSITIRDLMGLANKRADTRHYVLEKRDVKAHPFLTYEELGIYSPLIDNLAINEVRSHFGLPMVGGIEK